MARPPGYATGAHVLAGCLPDHQSTLPEPIYTPTLCALFSKHVSGCVYTLDFILERSYVETVYMKTQIVHF